MPNVIKSGTRRFRRRTFRRGGKRPVKQYQLRRAFKRFSRRIAKPQRKYLDTGSGNQIPTFAAGAYAEAFCLASNSTTLQTTSSIVQGVTQNDVIGYKGAWKSQMVRLSLTVNTAGGAEGQFVRIIHLLWKPNEITPATGSPNGPEVTTILQNANQGSSSQGNSGTYLSPYNREWAKQYKILKDKTYALSTVGNTSVVLDKHYMKMNKTFNFLQPNGPTGVYGYIPYVLFVTNSNTAADQPIINYYSRMTYVNF